MASQYFIVTKILFSLYNVNVRLFKGYGLVYISPFVLLGRGHLKPMHKEKSYLLLIDFPKARAVLFYH